MEKAFIENADKLFVVVTEDKRWDISDETLFIAFGLTYYGFCFSYGKLICFLEPEYINLFVVNKLVELGAGEKYVSGLVDYAYSTFQQPTEGLYSQLVEIGHSHFTSNKLSELTDIIFDNAKIISENNQNNK